MPLKPSEKEEEYFARLEFERKKKQEEEYEKLLWGKVRSGDNAAQVELADRMRHKTSPRLRKFLIDETPLQKGEIVSSNK